MFYVGLIYNSILPDSYSLFEVFFIKYVRSFKLSNCFSSYIPIRGLLIKYPFTYSYTQELKDDI